MSALDKHSARSCHKCGKDGHWASHCPTPAATSPSATVTCGACGEAGHGWKKCPVPVPLTRSEQKQKEQEDTEMAYILKRRMAARKLAAMQEERRAKIASGEYILKPRIPGI
jgi:hypothetical protein